MSLQENTSFSVGDPLQLQPQCAEDWLLIAQTCEDELYDATAQHRFDQLTQVYVQAFQWMKQNVKGLSSNEVFGQLLLKYAAVVSCCQGVLEGRKWFAIAMKEASQIPGVYVAAAEFEITRGDPEVAKQILKRAADLRIISPDKISSVASTLLAEHSGSLRLSTDVHGTGLRGHQAQLGSTNRKVLADITPRAAPSNRPLLADITPRTVGNCGSSAPPVTSSSVTSGMFGRARRVPLPVCEYDSDGNESSVQAETNTVGGKTLPMSEDSACVMDCSLSNTSYVQNRKYKTSGGDNTTVEMDSLSAVYRAHEADKMSRNEYRNPVSAGNLVGSSTTAAAVSISAATAEFVPPLRPSTHFPTSSSLSLVTCGDGLLAVTAGNIPCGPAGRSLAAGGRSHSATVLPAGDLLPVENLRSRTRINSAGMGPDSTHPSTNDGTAFKRPREASGGLDDVRSIVPPAGVSTATASSSFTATVTSLQPVIRRPAMRVPKNAPYIYDNDGSYADGDRACVVPPSAMATSNFSGGDLSTVHEQSATDIASTTVDTQQFSDTMDGSKLNSSTLMACIADSSEPASGYPSCGGNNLVPSQNQPPCSLPSERSRNFPPVTTSSLPEPPRLVTTIALHSNNNISPVNCDIVAAAGPNSLVSSASAFPAAVQPQSFAANGATDASKRENVLTSQRPAMDSTGYFKDCRSLTINGKPYVLLNVIGRGGSSKVFEALGPDRKICAVKCVSLETDDDSMVAGYRNEIGLLGRLQNCNEIVRLIDHMFDEPRSMLYVVMERGELDLATFFRTSKSRPEITRMLISPYWVQMLYAVQALHQQGIVHSDLKPANFILVGGIIKLIDFGIAKAIQPDRTSITCDQIVGTFNYMSPEAVIDLNGGVDLNGQSKPNHKISTKSDVWSLGCILYYLVYNHTPFESIRNTFLKLQAIINPAHEIQFPDLDTPHVVDVLRRCLDRNSRSRPSVDELLLHPYVTGRNTT